jgi:hypothetical protein
VIIIIYYAWGTQMSDPSANSPVTDTAEQYRKLLRGEISPEQYVRVVRQKVQATREETQKDRPAARRTLRRSAAT